MLPWTRAIVTLVILGRDSNRLGEEDFDQWRFGYRDFGSGSRQGN